MVLMGVFSSWVRLFTKSFLMSPKRFCRSMARTVNPKMAATMSRKMVEVTSMGHKLRKSMEGRDGTLTCNHQPFPADRSCGQSFRKSWVRWGLLRTKLLSAASFKLRSTALPPSSNTPYS